MESKLQYLIIKATCLHRISCFLNICFPYTSREEIVGSIKTTVDNYSKPLSTQARPFSQTRITQKIQSRNLSTSPLRSSSPTPSGNSDIDDSLSSTTTLHVDSPNGGREGSIYPDPETITSETIEGHLLTAGDPPLDLLVRTSGVKRLSDFMLWQCHQGTDIIFLDCLWPEFDLWHFLPVLVEWQWRQKHIEEDSQVNGVKKPKTKVR
jgi:ditrans,polycis-polyprenyl diphosphate synthase